MIESLEQISSEREREMTAELSQQIIPAFSKILERGEGEPRGFGTRLNAIVNEIQLSAPGCSLEELVLFTHERDATSEIRRVTASPPRSRQTIFFSW